jgi:filamentous hemagglutinin
MIEELIDPLAEVRGQRTIEGPRNDLSRISGEVVASIAKGYAFADHAADFGVATTSDLQSIVESTLASPNTQSRALSRGRSAFYDPSSNTIVIVNPPAPDKGTVFRPTDGVAYYDRLR